MEFITSPWFTVQEGWTPTSAPSLFAKMLTSEGEILEWEQPSSTNPYMKGDKVKYNIMEKFMKV